MPPATIEIALTDAPVEYAPPATAASVGGECVFLGRTRGETHAKHGALARLHYEAYRSMAEGTLRSIAHRAAERFALAAVRVHHALGPVDVGEASVLVQVTAGHRGEAFEGCRYVIDALKAEAPIWKREEWADGTTWSRGQAVRPAEEVPSP